MPWARYDDTLTVNGKITRLRALGVNGIAALGLHLLANTWSRHEGTMGHIPTYMAEQLAGRPGLKLAAMLVEVRMFDSVDDGWIVHDFDEFTDPNDPDPSRSAADRKREISEKRRVAGSAGGKAKAAKQTPGKSVRLLEQTSSPVPVPVPSEQVLNNSTPDNTPTAVDNSRIGEVLEVYAEAELQAAYAKGTKVTSAAGYKQAAKATGAKHPDLARWVSEYDAPVSAIASWLTGDKHSMQYFARTETLASVHELRRDLA
jgi:hypothetical protein